MLSLILAAAAAVAPPATAQPATAQPATAMTADACQRIAAQIKERPAAEADGLRRQLDWVDRCRYAKENAELKAPPRIVFMGDSITEFWKREHPAFFSSKVVDRGIAGQTSTQMLARFYADVIALKPQTVHLLAGANDVAGNTGPLTVEAYRNNMRAMVDLARAHGIKVVIGSILPAEGFWWNTAMRPAAQIVELNTWLRDYARAEGLEFIDYYAAMATPSGGLPASLADDRIHPNAAGYAVMERVGGALLR